MNFVLNFHGNYKKVFGEFYSPKSVIKESFKQRLLGEIWLDILDDRNLTSHTYDEIIANGIKEEIFNEILNVFKKYKTIDEVYLFGSQLKK